MEKLTSRRHRRVDDVNVNGQVHRAGLLLAAHSLPDLANDARHTDLGVIHLPAMHKLETRSDVVFKVLHPLLRNLSERVLRSQSIGRTVRRVRIPA